MARKRNIKMYSKGKSAVFNISTYLPKSDLKIIESFIEEKMYKDRSAFIRIAVKDRIHKELELRSERKKWTNYFNSKIKRKLEKECV